MLFTLDFAQARRPTVAGDHQLDSVHPFPGAISGCDPEHERAYVAAMGTLHPRNSGYVGAMQVELSNATRAPDAAASLCFGVHTRAGGWTWHWSPLPITIDYGSRTFSGQPGAGHFDLDVSTADVDVIALMMAYGHDVLSQVIEVLRHPRVAVAHVASSGDDTNAALSRQSSDSRPRHHTPRSRSSPRSPARLHSRRRRVTTMLDRSTHRSTCTAGLAQ